MEVEPDLLAFIKNIFDKKKYFSSESTPKEEH